jgi:hypothetical protein
MHVRRKLLDIDRNRGRACGFAERMAIALVYRCAAAQVWQIKGGLSVSTVSGSEQCEQSLILVNRQGLPVTERPAFGSEIERNYLYLT